MNGAQKFSFGCRIPDVTTIYPVKNVVYKKCHEARSYICQHSPGFLYWCLQNLAVEDKNIMDFYQNTATNANQNALVSNILKRSQRYFAHVTTVTLSWRVQNIVVIGRVYFTLECFEFSSNFEFDRNMLSGTGAMFMVLKMYCIWTPVSVTGLLMLNLFGISRVWLSEVNCLYIRYMGDACNS